MKSKNLINTVLVTTILTLFSLVSSGCIYNMTGIDGNGKVEKQLRSVSSFSGIDVGGAFEIILTQGNSEEVTIEADENLLEHIITRVKGNVLVIETDVDIRRCEAMIAHITFSEMDYIELSGATELTATNLLTFDRLDLDASGASEIEMEMKASSFYLDLSGASELTLLGNVEKATIDASGASELNTEELEIEYLKIDVSGACDARVFATKELDIEASGASSIKYKGDPESISTDISGASSIRKIN